jgi:hypothetical protein
MIGATEGIGGGLTSAKYQLVQITYNNINDLQLS